MKFDWGDEAKLCQEDGKPGLAAFCWLQYIAAHPEADSPLLRSVIDDFMRQHRASTAGPL